MRFTSKANSTSRWLLLTKWLALAGLIISLPFELNQPIWRLGLFQLSNAELFLGVALLCAGIFWWRQEQKTTPLPLSWQRWLACFVLATFVSALLAPHFRANAGKAALRTLSGILLMVAMPYLVPTKRDQVGLIAGLVGVGLVTAVLGFWEVWQNAGISWLAPFRYKPSVIGPFLRLTGPFDYTNQLAMFLEALLPFVVVGMVWAKQQRAYGWLVGLGMTLLIYLQAIILTLSRAGLGVVGVGCLVLIALIGWQQRTQPVQARLKRMLPWVGVMGVMIILVVVNLVVNPVLRWRFTSEENNDWYKATLEVPASFSAPANTTLDLPVTVHNEGIFVWHVEQPIPINLAGIWRQEATQQELTVRPRWQFSDPVLPHETATLTVTVHLPAESGQYTLIWDLVQEDVLWFSARQDVQATSQVTVLEANESNHAGNPSPFPVTLIDPDPPPPPIPGRSILWPTALQLWREHPITGIGLDNFRLTYGTFLALPDWDDAIHSNNWYIETLVSVGLAGAIPFFSWLALLLWALLRTPQRGWQLASAGAIVAFLCHGLLDYFLLFNATGLLFWLLVGLWLSQHHHSLDEPTHTAVSMQSLTG